MVSLHVRSVPATRPASGPANERKRGFGVKVVYDHLREEILTLALLPGSAIDEVGLAERFSMSRTPIREALIRLAGEGLIETLPNRSTIVAPLDLLNMHTYFDALVLMYRVTTKLAAERHRPDDLGAIHARQAEFTAAVRAQDAVEMIATNARFHLAIAASGGNSYFAGFFQRLLDDGHRILRLYYRSYDDQLPQCFVDEHDAIIAAVEARDGEAADRLAAAHGEQVVVQIQRLLSGGSRLSLSL